MVKITDKPARSPRRAISPELKAQLAVDVAERKLIAADKKHAELTDQILAVAAERSQLRELRDYLAANPLLNQRQSPPEFIDPPRIVRDSPQA